MKSSRKFRNLTILILSGFILFIFLFVYTFAKQDYDLRSGYELPKRVVKLMNNTEEFHVLKISHSMPVSHPLHKSITEKISFEIKKDPSRNIIPEIYPANKLGDPCNQFLAVQKGTIEMVLINVADLWQFKEFDDFSQPFRISDYDELEAMMSDPGRIKEITAFFRTKNIKFLGWSYGHFSQVVSTLIGRSDQDDSVLLKKPNETLNQFFMTMGLSVVPQSSSILDINITRQSLPLVELSSEELFKLGKDSQIDGIFLRNFLLPPFLYLVNLDFWLSLSSEEKALVESSVMHAISYQKDLMIDLNRNYQSFFDNNLGE